MLNNYTGNPTQHSDLFLTDKTDDVLLLLLERGVCFTSELARDTGIGIEEINKVLSMLKRNNFIKKAYPDADIENPLFKGRIVELNRMGVTSYEKIRQFSWWCARLPAVEYIKAKYSGQGKQIKGSLIVALNLHVQKEELIIGELLPEESAIFLAQNE